MRRVAFCLPYYRNQGMLDRQIAAVAALPKPLRDLMEMIVVDDGSPDQDKPSFSSPGCPLRIYRIGVDIAWNQDAARNIAAHEARSRWLLLTDIDHLVPESTWEGLEKLKLSKDSIYRFGQRKTLERDGQKPKLTPYKPHPNSWVMTQEMYWRVGGYDERFAGNYGTDGDFRDRCLETTRSIELIELPLWRVPRETIPDASTSTLERKNPEQGAQIRLIKQERDRIGDWRPLTLSFHYRLVGEC